MKKFSFVFFLLAIIGNFSMAGGTKSGPRLQFINGDSEVLKVFELKGDGTRDLIGEISGG